MTAPVCFVDTETTGLHPDRHEIWEVGLITPDGAEHEWLLPVHHLEDADPFALQIGGFHERYPYGNVYTPAPEKLRLTVRRQFARDFARLTHGCHLAGAVVSFDEERLRRLLLSQGVQPGWHHRLFCVETLTAGKLGRIVGGLSKCADALGISYDPDELHTALADARLARRIWRTVVSK